MSSDKNFFVLIFNTVYFFVLCRIQQLHIMWLGSDMEYAYQFLILFNFYTASYSTITHRQYIYLTQNIFICEYIYTIIIFICMIKYINSLFL